MFFHLSFLTTSGFTRLGVINDAGKLEN